MIGYILFFIVAAIGMTRLLIKQKEDVRKIEWENWLEEQKYKETALKEQAELESKRQTGGEEDNS